MYKLSVYHYEAIDTNPEINHLAFVAEMLQARLRSEYNGERSIFNDIKRMFKKNYIIKNITDKIKVTETYIDDKFLKFSIEAANNARTIFNIIVIHEYDEKTDKLRTLGSYVVQDVKFNIPNPPETPISFDIVIKLEDANVN